MTKKLKRPTLPEWNAKKYWTLYLRGEPFDAKEFLDKPEIVSDHCMKIPEKLQTKYFKYFTADLTTRQTIVLPSLSFVV